MDFNEFNNYVKVNEFWREEFTGYPAFCHSFNKGFALKNEFFKEGYVMDFLIFEKDYFYEITPMNGKKLIRKYLIDIFTNNKREFNKFLEKLYGVEKNLYSQFKENYSEENISETYTNLIETFSRLFSYSLAPEAFDYYTGDVLPFEIADKFNISIKKAMDVISIMSYPEEMSFMIKEEYELLDGNFENHAKKYFWIQNNFHVQKKLDENFFRNRKISKTKKEIEENIQKYIQLKKEISEKYNFGKFKPLFELLAIMSKIQDDRKKTFMIGNYYIKKLLEVISKKTNINYEDLLYYSPNEIINLVENDVKINISKRKELCIFVYKDELTIIEGEEAEKIFEMIREKWNINDIKGFVASAPVDEISGEARIVLDAHSTQFKKGEILVTSMTRPEFLPLMKNSLAIITNEGGITSHAAVLSRELGIPCVIGTKNATNILKDGDKVYINLKTGEIKVIS